jgi:hypothetical protein
VSDPGAPWCPRPWAATRFKTISPPPIQSLSPHGPQWYSAIMIPPHRLSTTVPS